MDAKAHWESVYRKTPADGVSWYQSEPTLSLDLIRRAAAPPGAAILDVGGGASTLVDGLLAAGYQDVTVLDLSHAALETSRLRVGAAGAAVRWTEADVRSVPLGTRSIDLWHDRAVFHFLTAAGDRADYVAEVERVVRPGGSVLVATFADGGPERCSGLDVVRYGPEALHAEFGARFDLVEHHLEAHVTPGGASQSFTYVLFRMRPGPGI